MFFIADIFVETVQYGSVRELCNLMQENQTKDFYDQVDAIAILADQKGVSFDDYDSEGLLQDETIDINSSARNWTYQYCSQFGWFQTPNKEHPMRSSRLGLSYWTEMCQRVFGDDFPTKAPNFSQVNLNFGGLNNKGHNIFFGNGHDDPWQWAAMRELTDPNLDQVAKISECVGCAHCAEMYTPKEEDPAELKATRELVRTTLNNWLKNPDSESASFLQ